MPSFAKRVWIAVAIAAGVLIAVGGVAILLRGLLLLFAGALLGVALTQLSRRVASWLGVRYGVAFAGVVLLIVASSAATAYFMGHQIAAQITQFTQQLDQASTQITTEFEKQPWMKWFDALGSDETRSWIPTKLLSTARSAVAVAFSALGAAILIAFLGFYFALQPNVYCDAFIKLMPLKSRNRVRGVQQDIADTLWWWFLGRLVGMTVIGIGSGIGLWALGIPLPVTLGVLAGLLNFVPNLGPLMASVPPILFALQQGPELALYVAGFYLALQFVESYFLTPLIDQQQISLPPALILSCQLLFGLLAGFLGLLMATPLTAVLVILIHEFYVKDVLGDPS